MDKMNALHKMCISHWVPEFSIFHRNKEQTLSSALSNSFGLHPEL